MKTRERLPLNIEFAGTLQYQLQLSEVLRRVTEGTPEPLSGLLLNDEVNGRHGTIVISQSRFVTGAELKDENYNQIATGYQALRQICQLVSAQFKYVTAKPEFFEKLELTLHIEIEQLLQCLPDLPQDLSELQDTDSLLDKVFHPEETPVVKPIEPKVEAPEPKKKRKTWHSVPVRKAEEIYEKETEPRFATMEERAMAEIGPPGTQFKKKQKPFLVRLIERIGNFFYSAYSAPVYILKKLALPVFVPLLAIVVIWQVWGFVSAKMRGVKLIPSAPVAARKPSPERSARSAPVYHAPQPQRHYATAPASHVTFDSSHPPLDLPTQSRVIQTPPPAAPYETPTETLNLPHRRAYQAAPGAQH
ncbi:MAG TPA: hypothetical protein V6C89_15220 [Drouetiella sp.]